MFQTHSADRASRCLRVCSFVLLTVTSVSLAPSRAVQAQVVASDMLDSGSQNLLSYSNPFNGAFASAGDGFQKYQRGVSATIPFSVTDDSLIIFPPDTLGIIRDGNTDIFFGVTDTQNPQNSGPVSATWVFDISGATDLVLSIDMGAMGDFESSDTFEWSYSIDGNPVMTAFTASADEAAVQTYTMEGGAVVTLNDPMLVNGELLSNELTTHLAALIGSGTQLTLTLTAQTDGGSEAFAFQNLKVLEGGLPIERLAFDMVESADQRLTSFTNVFDGAFASAGDGFQKYQRGVSASIPFSLADDSLSIFPSDSLGIIKEGNTDVFFGIVDTENPQNSGPVSATWVFDISGGTGLGLSIDMGAMGDFESNDFFVWSYSIDGSPEAVAFASTVDETGSNAYTLEGGSTFTLNDPMLVQGTILSNDLATFRTPIAGTGSSLSLTLSAQFNGGSEAVAFQNVIVGTGFEGPEPTPVVEIWEIQGDGASSPFDAVLVESPANIVTALAPNGFFMQTPPARSDFNVDTSDGIFVFTGSTPAVAVGDEVDVTGTVDEFFGFTEITDDPSVSVLSSGNPLPAAVIFDANVPSPDPASPSCAIEFECYEGMLVQIVDGSVGGPNQRFGSDPVAEVHISAADRAFRAPGVEFPGLGVPGIATWDGNPEVFELDPDKLGLPNRLIAAGSRFDATGVIGFEFGGYELWPASLVVRDATIPEAVRHRDRAEFTVGSLNLFRLFDDVDDPADDSTGRTRDDSVVSTEEYERRRAKFAGYILEVLDAPDVLGVQEAESLKVLEDLAADIAAIEPAVVYSAYLEEGNDVGTIDVGFLVRDSVSVDAVIQLGKDEILEFDGSLLHDRPPLLLQGRSVGEGADYPFAVIVVHNRSLGGIDSPTDGERVRAKRLAQAQSIAGQVQAMQTDDPSLRLIVAGDFNGFEFSDGYVDVLGQVSGTVDPAASLVSGPDLVEPDLIVQTLSVPMDERYSFVFRGSAQTLDHALTSSALDASVRGYEFGRGNADAAVDLINDGLTSLRSSDHDGVVLFITKDLDDDGVNDDADVCPATVIPEMTANELGTNRFALADGDFAFDTNAPAGNGPGRQYSTRDTAGCSCSQIIEAQGLGAGHAKFGCSIGAMDNWVRLVAE